jgi:cytochrome c-type biogenesis protein
MSELVQAFVLGNSAILTNVCILPLYPGLIAFMAGNASNEAAQRATKWMGLLVLLGVLTLMTAVGGLLYLLQQSFGAILPVVLPVIYAIVIVLGALMVFGINPFNRLQTMNSPAMRNPYVGAYFYGILLGPMTLPCAGPIVVSAFLLGSGSITALGDSLLYFFVFGLGFGWPLVLLPLLAAPFQRRFTRWMTQNYGLLTRISGVLLVGIGLLGIFAEVIPNA